MLIDDLTTPAVLVDAQRLDRNISRMQAKASDNHASLRPHIKTHKSVDIAQLQVDQGAHGLTVATIDEAETFVHAGFSDIRVAYPVIGNDKYERLLNLMDDARISFCVDTPAGVKQASSFFADAGREVEVLMEVDVGHGRCGVPFGKPDEAIQLAKQIVNAPGLQFAGLLTHAGQGYHGPRDGETPEHALRRASLQERDRILDVAALLFDAGVSAIDRDTFEVSIGSTPTITYFENTERDGLTVTEIRPGNYVFHDAIQVGLGACPLDDCALTVLGTIVSKRRDDSGTERAYIDAGKKVVTTDKGARTDGYGIALYNATYMREHPHVDITGLSEEHGWLSIPGAATFGVGDRVRFVPNHACVTVATQHELVVVDDDEVIDRWPVAHKTPQTDA
ncbi:metal-activated pyridoxal enzyme [Longibacter salinarum]|uniref:Metal-activated pyridoxal enzyme n=1 Tax=Longibacter salinarum TaxID=1850348 RepID=A0A2A8CWM6_9BACT|nr:alanine racemase [Longibacter salinarum]PEN13129.1 metal-activated pyridoxal enzyme [Longibacter salinarum]